MSDYARNFKEDRAYDPDFVDPESFSNFSELPDQIKVDLTIWANDSHPPARKKKLLLNLYKSGNFIAWDCPECKTVRVYQGTPTDFSEFQSCKNQDFSFFGDKEKYTETYIEAMCDSCRMKR